MSTIRTICDGDTHILGRHHDQQMRAQVTVMDLHLEALAEPLTAPDWDSSGETNPLATPGVVIADRSPTPITAADLDNLGSSILMGRKLTVWDHFMILIQRIWGWFR